MEFDKNGPFWRLGSLPAGVRALPSLPLRRVVSGQWEQCLHPVQCPAGARWLGKDCDTSDSSTIPD